MPIKLFLIWFARDREESAAEREREERREIPASQFWRGSVDSVVHVWLKCQLQLYVRAYH